MDNLKNSIVSLVVSQVHDFRHQDHHASQVPTIVQSGSPEVIEDNTEHSSQNLIMLSNTAQDLIITPTSSFSSTPTMSQHTISLLPVHSPSQLEVHLPISTSLSDTMPNETSGHPMITRLKSSTINQKSYTAFIASCPELHYLMLDDDSTFVGGFSFVASINDSDKPSSFRKASIIPQWQSAMQEKYNALKSQGTWQLVFPLHDRSIIGSKWVYKIKKNPDGNVFRYKTRLLAQGFSQEQGLDYSETFSLVVRHTTMRLILSLTAIHKWELRQLDIKNAFLHGKLQEEVYMKQPQGFVDPSHPNYVCKLVKSLYGLKQAPRAWNSKFTSYLPTLGFSASFSDTNLFVKLM
ncbi:hypothetical protein PS1_025239 [Malus domestica]